MGAAYHRDALTGTSGARRALRTATAFTIGAALLAAPAPAKAAFPAGFTDQTIISSLSTPVGMTFLPDGRMIVVEQYSARIRLLVQGTLGRPDPMGTIPNVQTGGNEQGLLGIAVDPGWPTRPYIYVHYDYAPTPNIYVSRFTVHGDLSDPLGDSLVVDLSSEYHLLTDIPDIASNHNGGTLRFGTDGMLYDSIGEDATACAAQDTASLRGVILRLDVSGLPAGAGGPPAKSLITPSGNPFSTSLGNAQNARLMWAIGLRNPFRFQVDPATGDLFVGDVGQSMFEEVDWVTSGGRNFGWPFREGPSTYITCPSASPGPLTDPIAWYDRSGFGTGAAVISGPIYHLSPAPCATAFPADYDGDYFYAEYYQGFVRRIRNFSGTWAPAPVAPGQPTPSDWANGLQTVSDFAVGRDGALWYLRQFNSSYQPNTGSIHRVLGPNGAPHRPGVNGDLLTLIGTQDTASVHFAAHNTGTCAGAFVYRLRDPQAMLSPASTPLAGITPVLAVGDSFELNVQITTPAVCDTMIPDTLEFSAHPLDFPDSVVVHRTMVRCNSTDALGVSSFTIALQGAAVRLQWTARNTGISEFNVYRSGPGAPGLFQRINPAPLPFTGAPSYTYIDGTAALGQLYTYEVGATIGPDEYLSVPLSLTLPPLHSLQLGILRPNPTEGSVSLAYFLGADTQVDVTVRDLSGRRVRRLLANVTQSAGPQAVTWDGSDDGGRRSPSGLYFIEVRAGNTTDTRRIALAR